MALKHMELTQDDLKRILDPASRTPEEEQRRLALLERSRRAPGVSRHGTLEMTARKDPLVVD